MKDFKFFQKEDIIPVYLRRLNAFHIKLDELYCRHTNFPYDSEEFDKTIQISNEVMVKIVLRQITRYQEIGDFYYNRFREEFGVTYYVLGSVKELIINEVENEIV
jgi:hypothetical protein